MKQIWGFVILLVVVLLGNSSCESNNYNKLGFVYGHAGTSLSEERYIYPPNTKPSIDYALQVLAADGVEIDVQLTADGNLVLFHDQTINEITDASGCINSMTLVELKELNYYKKYKIESLIDILQTSILDGNKLILDVRHYNECAGKKIDFEIFNHSLNDVLKSLNSAQKENIIVSTQDINLLIGLSDSSIKKALEIDNISEGINSLELNNFDFLMLKLSQMTKASHSLLENNKIQFGLFNIKTSEEIKQALNFNFSFLITDNIPKTKHLIKQ